MDAVAGPANSRATHLDGIRGLAALVVALSHFVATFYSSLFDSDAGRSHFSSEVWLNQTGITLFFSPGLGVAIFFVLSGFVLCGIRSENLLILAANLIRRWVRLCLPVLAISIVILLFMKMGAFSDVNLAAQVTKSSLLGGMYAPACTATPLWQVIKEATFGVFFNHAGAISCLNPVIWTIPIELVGSLCLLVANYVVLQSGILSRHAWLFGCFAVWLTWGSQYWGFGWGIALYQAWQAAARRAPRWPARRFSGRTLIGIAALGAGLFLGGTPYYATGGPHAALLQAVQRYDAAFSVPDMQHSAAVLMVASSLFLWPMQAVLNSSPCQYLGRISFMLYLVQIPALCAVAPLLLLHLYPATGYNLAAMMALLTYLTATIALADIATRLIDRPSIGLSRAVVRVADERSGL